MRYVGSTPAIKCHPHFYALSVNQEYQHPSPPPPSSMDLDLQNVIKNCSLCPDRNCLPWWFPTPRPPQAYFESEYQLTVPVCGSHRMISTEEPEGAGGLYLLFLGSDIFLPAFPKRESPQTCGKMSALFSLSTNGPKWCYILVGFIFGPWLICTDFCFPGVRANNVFYHVEKLSKHSYHTFRCIQAIRHLVIYRITPSEVHQPPEGKKYLWTSLPSSHTVARIPGLLGTGTLPCSGKFYPPRAFFCV